MKRIIFAALTLVTILMFGFSTASAQYDPNSQICSAAQSSGSSAQNSDLCTTNATTANPLYGRSGIITNVIKILSYIIGIIAFLMIVIAGFMYTTSGGDPQKTNVAKDTILFAVIGLAVVAVAQVLVLFVIDRVG